MTNAYFLNLFSPETYDRFLRSDRTVTGFRVGQLGHAKRVKPRDLLICYVTGVSRWAGVLQVVGPSFLDDGPLFQEAPDPYMVRFPVLARVLLPVQSAVPIRSEEVWEQLSFTRGRSKVDSRWTGAIRASLVELRNDGEKLVEILERQRESPLPYPITAADATKLSRLNR